MFLHNGNLPTDKQIALQLINQVRKFLLYEGGLWQRNGDKPILHVVLNLEICNRIIWDAHDGSSHRGRDPMFQKIKDSYWWPNMYFTMAQYCQTCHECQLCSTYKNTIPIQPQYVQTILRQFDADMVNMLKGKQGISCQKLLLNLYLK